MSNIDQYQFLGSFDLRGHVYGEYKPDGFGLSVRQGGIKSQALTNTLDRITGAVKYFEVCFGTWEEELANQFLVYVSTLDQENEDFDSEEGADINLYIRDPDWYYRVWGVVVTPSPVNRTPMDFTQRCYNVACYLYNKFSYHRTAQIWTATSQTLTETLAVSNLLGHIPVTFEELEITCAYVGVAHVASLALNFGGASQAIATAANTNEVWTLIGMEDRLLQSYSDSITNGTIWAQDWTGSGTFDTDHIELNNGESAYIRLSGPNRLRNPVTMTADLSLDSGGATGEATVLISEDAVTWYEVLDQDDFETGSTEYSLIGSDHMTDCYVKLLCTSGTNGKYLNVGSIAFDCERWLEYGGPKVAAGETATATLTGTGTVTIDGTFRPMRRFT